MTELFDTQAFAVVIGGTLAATLVRCGWSDARAALASCLTIWTRSFDETANRAALARWASAIAKKGRLAADEPHPPDPALASLLKQLPLNGSIEDFCDRASAARVKRDRARAKSVRVLETAGELAPVFGLAGTLLALSQLSLGFGADATQGAISAVATAVMSSLYGILGAHLVYFPLAAAIERKGERGEMARARLVDWFVSQIGAGSGASLSSVRSAA
jgi:chemotaxis protein MotA